MTSVRIGLMPQAPASPEHLGYYMHALLSSALARSVRMEFVWLPNASNPAIIDEIVKLPQSVRGASSVSPVQTPAEVGEHCDIAFVAPHDEPLLAPANVWSFHVEAGNGAAKLTGDAKNLTYSDQRMFYEDGMPRYTRVLVSSQYARERVLSIVPKLSGSVGVVGDPASDDLLRTDRNEARRKLGLPADRQAVLLTSTWNGHSAVARLGGSYLASLLALPSKPTVLVACHPRLTDLNTPYAIDWRRQVLMAANEYGSRVVLPHQGSLQEMAAAADIAIGDTSSMLLRWAVTRKPVVFVEGTDGGLDPSSPIAHFRAEGRSWDGRPGLSLDWALKDSEPASTRVLSEVTSHPGGVTEALEAEVLAAMKSLKIEGIGDRERINGPAG